ncbi:hypothetical protein ACFFX0_04360 [Citricoccus parietis]|uniref:Uncharacterized protein n=1 Tax=Citricoccus parietis TaxID=592307 RepID=A0ABV5FUU7_9MICC
MVRFSILCRSGSLTFSRPSSRSAAHRPSSSCWTASRSSPPGSAAEMALKAPCGPVSGSAWVGGTAPAGTAVVLESEVVVMTAPVREWTFRGTWVVRVIHGDQADRQRHRCRTGRP